MKNGVMLQFFEWKLPNDGQLWNRLRQDAASLNEAGITAVWIPPAYKADEQADEGYATYDLFDLGEFDQKGTIRTKYGTKEELIAAIRELHKHQISVYLDTVLNHKAGGEYPEVFRVQEVDPKDRYTEIGKPCEIEAYTGYNFPGRNNWYSDFKWHSQHFSGVDHDLRTKRSGIFRILGEKKYWSKGVDNENGNYDYLLCNDIDLDHPEVIRELNRWGVWVANELQLDGMRLDAIKHMEKAFVKQFIQAVRADRGDNFFVVGEYWHRYYKVLEEYVDYMDQTITLFDVPFHFKMHYISVNKEKYDLRHLMEETLVNCFPKNAVTFVENHDTQKGSSLQSEVEEWFKPIAYGLILLMEKGYPCLFYGDYYDLDGEKAPYRQLIKKLLKIRKTRAYGTQHNYFQDRYIVGFSRLGDTIRKDSGLAYLFSIKDDGAIEMFVGESHAGETWHEMTGSIQEEVLISPSGKATFKVKGKKMAIWIKK